MHSRFLNIVLKLCKSRCLLKQIKFSWKSFNKVSHLEWGMQLAQTRNHQVYWYVHQFKIGLFAVCSSKTPPGSSSIIAGVPPNAFSGH